MIIEKVVVGVLQENCYIVGDDKSKEAVVVDPGDDGELIVERIERLGLLPILIVNTHYHFDHTGANYYIKECYNIPIAIGKKDAGSLEESYKDAVELMIHSHKSPKADVEMEDGENIIVGRHILYVMETPGHTKGSICLYSKKDKILFSGDTLFYESVGRWDLQGGSKKELFKSLDKLFELPEDTVVYPGHGEKTTVGFEVTNNPYKKGVL